MSLIISLFCPHCKRPYDDTDRRPRIGSCRHSICHPCIETRKNEKCADCGIFHDSDCPICKKENAFSEVLFNFELCKMLEAFNERVTEESFQQISNNPKKLELGACKSCFTTERLRMCVTCAEESGLLKKLPNGKFHILEPDKTYHLAKSVYFCSDCIADGQPDHPNHSFLPLSKIDAGEMDLEHWHYIVHAMFLDRKMKEEMSGPILEEAQLYKQFSLEIKRQALKIEVEMRSTVFQELEDEIKLRHKQHVGIFSVPELVRAKEKSFELAQPALRRYMKLQERRLWYIRDFIGRDVEIIKQDMSQNPTTMKFKEEIIALSTKFDSYRFTTLTQIEADQIDEDLNAKLESVMQSMDFYDVVPAEKKFYVYKAVCHIMRNLDDRHKEKSKKMKKEFANFEAFFENRLEELEEEMKRGDKAAQRLFLFEITEKSFKLDKFRIEELESHCELLEANLIWDQWFPNRRDPTSEDFYYQRLFSEKYLKGSGLPAQKEFSRSMF